MWVVPPVALGTLCQYFYTNYVNQELFYKKTVMIAVNSIIAALINTGLNYVFIKKYGYAAAAYTTLAGYFILMCLHFISTRFILKEKLYADGRYFIMVITVTAAGLLIMTQYDGLFGIAVRYILAIGLAIAFAFMFKDVIIKRILHR
ncbi:MAG: polysaccharide biosynthesis C-terminal domain-containing protein [Lachnospiraceae bacterium]|nr:polysaccharide biosynthesis C-terminal domain-containing protein [Lachnospiraceae bacterium]